MTQAKKLKHPPRSPAPSVWPSVFIGAILFLIAFAVFYPATRNGFIDYDDNDYVTANYHVQSGLVWPQIVWAFTNTDAANWHPLTWLSHMLDCQLYGPNPWGHHLTSVLFHACNVVLVFLVFQAMGAGRWPATAAALLFGLHPLRVESVAWIAERKDVLSLFFWLLALWTWLAYAKKKDSGQANVAIKYILSLIFFAFGLMSKPMVVTLPFVLLLLDFWPLQRFTRKSALRLVVEKIPFFALAVGGSVLAFFAQKTQGAVTTYLTFAERVETALIAYVRYIGKFLWPTRLAVIYPHPVVWPKWEVAGSVVFLGLVFAAVWAARKSRPYLLVGWLWYFGTLVPVIGLVQIGSQSLADRYTYLPVFGFMIMLIWSAKDFLGGPKSLRQISGVATGVTVLVCVMATERQLAFWKDTGTLFSHAIAVTDNNFIAEKALADFDATRQLTEDALAHYREALRIYPGYTGAHLNFGALLNNLGHHEEAVAEFQKVMELEPTDPSAYNNLGAILGDGHLDESIALFEKAVQMAPNYLDARKNLGQSYDRKGRLQEAMAQYEAALKIQPDADAEYLLALDLEKSGRQAEAIQHLKISVALRPSPNPASQALERLQPPVR